jgi:hypothetical protein
LTILVIATATILKVIATATILKVTASSRGKPKRDLRQAEAALAR